MEFKKNYLQLDKTQGIFFLYSKEEKEGYKKNESSTGKISYRKYFDKGVTGELDSVTIYESDFGKQISFSIQDGENHYYAPISIFNQKGNIDSYAESAIKFLPQLEKKQNITLFPYKFTPEGTENTKVGVSFKVSGEKIKPALTNAYYVKDGSFVDGDIPAVKWVTKLGKNSPSAASLEAKEDYLFKVLETEVERLTWKTNSNTPDQPVEKPKSIPTPTAEEAFSSPEPLVYNEEDEDDLPF
jgi:hypothetical protein